MPATPIIPDYAIIKILKTVNYHFIFEKCNYHHFLRLNNRKEKHSLEDILNAGYTHVVIKNDDPSTMWKNVISSTKWCKENLKKGSYISKYNCFCFAYKEDAVHFSMESMYM